jgi:hypothetical protein
MKTIIKISAIFAFMVLCSGAMAQSCDLTIYDNDNTSGAYYDLAIQIWDYTVNPPVLLNTEPLYDVYIRQSGELTPVSLSWGLGPDYSSLKFYIYAQNTSTSKTGSGGSVQYFDSYDYYYNSPPVTLSIQ